MTAYISRSLLPVLVSKCSSISQKTYIVLLIVSALFLSPLRPVLFAQAVSATLVGTVTDKTGAAAANAKVTITETSTGLSREAAANDSGNYTFPNLQPGSYAITAEATGFKRETRPSIDVIVNTTTRMTLHSSRAVSQRRSP